MKLEVLLFLFCLYGSTWALDQDGNETSTNNQTQGFVEPVEHSKLLI